MYNVNNFCNIIANLRKERGWTQNMLAKKLDISPQSISKWECGVGLPNVTLFPVIAEVMQVPIEVLFGKQYSECNRTESYFSYYSESDRIQVHLGNICRVEFIEDEREQCSVTVFGDEVFLNYFDVEQDENSLRINVKNPSGSEERWEKYDRKGYKGENYVRICTGRKKDESDIQVINYLDLNAFARENDEGNYEVECSAEERNHFFRESQKSLETDGLDESIALHRKQLEEYPNDVYFQLSLCGLLYKKYKNERDENTEKEIFELCEKIEKSGKTDMQCGARRFEALMYVLKKEYVKAEELINAMPSYLCGRELLIAEVYAGEKKRECYKNIIKMLEEKLEYYKMNYR